ncbi:MAG: hypothetical protein ACRC1P_09855 [Cellulosilyticaceae bacterium]
MTENKLRELLASCKTQKQVLKMLKDNGIKIHKDNTKSDGYFNIWLDDTTRIYYRKMTKSFKLQLWNKIETVGTEKAVVPSCHGYKTTIDRDITVNHGYNGFLVREAK